MLKRIVYTLILCRLCRGRLTGIYGGDERCSKECEGETNVVVRRRTVEIGGSEGSELERLVSKRFGDLSIRDVASPFI